MNVEAWPFLVGRNKNLGYQTIVSPQFLIERDFSMLLAESAGGDDSKHNEAYCREIFGFNVGDLMLIFRAVRARARDYDLGGDDTLKDKGGRPIRLFEGFVIKGRKRNLDDIQITQNDFYFAHDQVKGTFREFWKADYDFLPWSSSPFSLSTVANLNEQVRLIIQAPYEAPLALNSFVPTPNGNEQVRPGYREPFKGPTPPWRLIIITFVVLVLLIIGGVVAVSTVYNPSQTLSALCDGLHKPDYTEAYAQLSNKVDSSISQKTFTNFFSNKEPQVSSCSYSDVITSGSSGTAKLQLTFGNGKHMPLKIQLSQASFLNSWKIDNNIISELQNNG